MSVTYLEWWKKILCKNKKIFKQKFFQIFSNFFFFHPQSYRYRPVPSSGGGPRLSPNHSGGIPPPTELIDSIPYYQCVLYRLVDCNPVIYYSGLNIWKIFTERVKRHESSVPPWVYTSYPWLILRLGIFIKMLSRPSSMLSEIHYMNNLSEGLPLLRNWLVLYHITSVYCNC